MSDEAKQKRKEYQKKIILNVYHDKKKQELQSVKEEQV